ncbi:MAG: 6-hydroxymethylpterin diphosphokinase MptE-like protein [Spirochaetota bacterium]
MSYSLDKARNGAPTLSVIDESGSRVYLHSRYDPAREAGMAAETIDQSRYDVLVVLGTGLGYHLVPVLESIDRYRQVLLVEYLDIQGEIAEKFTCPALLRNNNVHLISGESTGSVMDILSATLDLDKARGIQVYEHPPSVRAFSRYYGEIRQALGHLITRKSSNLITRISLGWKYLKNGLMNLQQLSRVFPVAALNNTFKDMPAIILIPGPSLDRNLSLIARSQQNVYIIAVDSALSSCAALGIVPDICLSIDPQSQVNAHIFNWNKTDTIHVRAVTSHPATMGYPYTFLSLNTHPTAQAVEELYPHTIGSVDSKTGTVAGDAIVFAQKAGFNPVLVTGLDFSFPGLKIYASDSQYQHTYRTRANRVLTAPGLNMKYILQSSGGIIREGLYTRKSFLQYMDTIESLSADSSNTLYQSHGPGLALKSMQKTDPAEFIHSYARVFLSKKSYCMEVLSELQPLEHSVSMQQVSKIFTDHVIQARIIDASLHNPEEKMRTKALRLFNGFTR